MSFDEEYYTHLEEYYNDMLTSKNKKYSKCEGCKNDRKFIIKSKDKGYSVIQNYINDVFTINKRKLNIRAYIVIICYKNLFNCYIYNDGKCIYTNNDYDYNSRNLHSHITSLDLDLDIYKKNPLTIKDLQVYMNSNKMNYNKLWNNIPKVTDGLINPNDNPGFGVELNEYLNK